jgi:NADH-quinone oxidoreductase subunit M
LASLSAFGLLLGAWYLLTLLQRVFFGEVKEPRHDGHSPTPDLNFRELAALVPIAAVCVAIGIVPQPFLDTAKPEIQVLARIADRARARAADAETAGDNPARSERALRVARTTGDTP